MAVTQSTSSVIKLTAAADAISGTLYVDRIRWVGATTAAHALVVSDAAGTIYVHSVANAANFIEDIEVECNMAGVVITTLGSGTVYLYRK